MQDELVMVSVKTSFTRFISVIKEFIVMPIEESGFDQETTVYRFKDAAGNSAFMVRRGGEDVVSSFGSVLLSKSKLSLLVEERD